MLTIKQKSINLLLSFIFHKDINNKIDKKHIAKNKILLPKFKVLYLIPQMMQLGDLTKKWL